MIATPIAPPPEFHEAFSKHRPDLMRHCYRMLGSYADAEDLVQQVFLQAWRARGTYAGEAPVLHWLMRIATNACLKALAQRRSRGLPQLDRGPVPVGTPIERLQASSWVTPAPDMQLFPGPEQEVEAREDLAIAFIALLQRLSPKQRAVLLLKDVVGWPSDDIASALGLSVSSVSSALHRARETIARTPRAQAQDPPPTVLQEYIRCWEQRDIEGLVALLKEDVVFAMPPHATWFRGGDAVRRFVQTPPFAEYWSKGLLATQTRANGSPAIAWYTPGADAVYRPDALQLVRFSEGRVAEVITFVGAQYLRGFNLPSQRTCATQPT